MSVVQANRRTTYHRQAGIYRKEISCIHELHIRFGTVPVLSVSEYPLAMNDRKESIQTENEVPNCQFYLAAEALKSPSLDNNHLLAACCRAWAEKPYCKYNHYRDRVVLPSSSCQSWNNKNSYLYSISYVPYRTPDLISRLPFPIC
jgi:hypothetical protein